MNTVHKKILAIIFLFSLISFPGVSFAEDPSGDECANQVIADPGAFICPYLNCPHNEFIVTILEENIGTEGSFSVNDNQEGESDTNIINCFRQTRCTTTYDPEKDPDKKTPIVECNSSYLQTCDPSPVADIKISCDRVQAIVSLSGLSMLFTYIALIYKWGAGIVGIVSVMFMIYGGIMMMTAGDNSESIDKAKGKIVQSFMGLALLFLSAIILYTINPTFFTL